MLVHKTQDNRFITRAAVNIVTAPYRDTNAISTECSSELACRLIKANRQAYEGGVKAPWGHPEPVALSSSPKRQARSSSDQQKRWSPGEAGDEHAAGNASLHRPQQVSQHLEADCQ